MGLNMNCLGGLCMLQYPLMKVGNATPHQWYCDIHAVFFSESSLMLCSVSSDGLSKSQRIKRCLCLGA